MSRLWMAALLVLPACAIPRSKISPPISMGSRAAQTGIASWYGPGFNGKTTATGAIYDQNELTAAHQTLPLGTRVLVTNLDNGSSTAVMINDRGPFVKGRIIDLSYAAGQALGMIGPGTVPVRVEVIDSPQPVPFIRSSLDYTLQVGSFSQLSNASQLRDRLATSYSDVAIVPLRMNDVIYYRVQIGTFSDRAVAEEQARRIAQSGIPVTIMEK